MKKYCLLSLLVITSLMLKPQVYKKNPRQVADTNLVLPPSWAFGILYGGYTNQQETIERVRQIKQHGYPIDAYWIDSWFWSFADKGVGPKKYIDFVADTVGYPDRKAMWSYLQKEGVKGGFWIWDCIQKNGNEQVFADFKEKNFFRDIFFNSNTWHNGSSSTAMFQNGKQVKGTQCGNIDFDNPGAVTYFKRQMKHFFDEGADFVKLDRTSSINVCKAMFEMSQEFGKETKGRGFILSHTGGMESEEYKKYPTKWTDDTRGDWNIDSPLIEFNSWVPYVAFKENIALYTDPSKLTSQIPFLTNDMGGFDMGKISKPGEELYIRWMQFSMFCPITEVFSQPENPSANLAWNYSPFADSLFKMYAQRRLELFPYLYSYAHQCRIKGEPFIKKIPGQLYEFLFGNEMLIAPVYEKGAVRRKVFLPEGRWTNYWTGEILDGNQSHIVSAPLEQIPIFMKEGALVPRRLFASSVEKGNNDLLELEVYPGRKGSFELIEDDGTSNEYLSGGFAVSSITMKQDADKRKAINIGAVQGSFKGMSPVRKIQLILKDGSKPVRVVANKKEVEFIYDPSKKETRVASVSVSKKASTNIYIYY